MQGCQENIISEKYQDYIVEYAGEEERIKSWYGVECYQIVNQKYAIVYRPGDQVQVNINNGVFGIPHCYGKLSSREILEQAGVANVQRQPALELFGQGVLVGFVDTGIDYTHPAFVEADGTSRILKIWDQSLETSMSQGTENTSSDEYPKGFHFGREYTRNEINAALASPDPLGIVPSMDYDGHGTWMAGVACGNEEVQGQFSGVAPLAGIVVVKCKEAKQALRDYYQIPEGVPCYAESDIMLGVRYLRNQALEFERPIVICIGLGTNMGGHNRGGPLGDVLSDFGDNRGTFVVAGVGNEGDGKHHFQGMNLQPGQSQDVELKVANGRQGFTMELWANAPDLYSVGLISPSGEYSGKTVARPGNRQQISFLLEDTRVDIEYLVISYESGDECIRLRFQAPEEGIWIIRIFNENDYVDGFHLWLPMEEFVSRETYFLQSDPRCTICDPANNGGIITVGYYNSFTRGVVPGASRGYTRDGRVKPDVAAPGVDLVGPLSSMGVAIAEEPQERIREARYVTDSGSSGATALTAGAVALLVQWGIVQRNDISMDSITVAKYLIRGAERLGIGTPDPLWGGGLLNLFGTFDNLRPK